MKYKEEAHMCIYVPVKANDTPAYVPRSLTIPAVEHLHQISHSCEAQGAQCNVNGVASCIWDI